MTHSYTTFSNSGFGEASKIQKSSYRMADLRTQSRSRCVARAIPRVDLDLAGELGLTKRMLLLQHSLPVEHDRKGWRGGATGDRGHQEALAIVARLIAAPNKKSIQ